MANNNGAQKPTTITIPWLTVVLRADPDFNKARTRQLEYDFSAPGRNFYGDPAHRGAYGAEFSRDFSDDFRTVTAGRAK
jgi:hypothetical protein